MPTINRGLTFDYDVYQEWKQIIDCKRLKQSNVLQGHMEFDINTYREEQRNKKLTLQPLTIKDIDKKLSKSAIGSIYIINNDNETEKNKDRDKEIETIVNYC